MSLFALELLLDTTVEQEGNVCVFLGLYLVSVIRDLIYGRTGDVALLDTLFTEPFGKDVSHGSRGESDGEWESSIVSSYGGDV